MMRFFSKSETEPDIDFREDFENMVDEMTAKIARAAFSGRNTRVNNYNFESGIINRLKQLLEHPITKDITIIATVMGLKIALYLAYRKSSEMGLEIAEL